MTYLLIALCAVLAVVIGAWRFIAARRRLEQSLAERESANRAALLAARKDAAPATAVSDADAEAARASARAKAERVIAAEQARRKAAIQKAQNLAQADAERRAKAAEAATLASTLPTTQLPKVERTVPLAPPPAGTAEPADVENTAPAARPAAAAPPRQPVVPTVLKTAAQTLVMVVDDSKMVRVKSGRLLASHEFQVVTAVDGIDALKQLEHCCPDMVITDVDMPGMDGFGLVAALRGDPRTQHIPLVMITSAEDRHREQAMGVGVGLVMGKPYDEAALIAHIRSFKFFARADEDALACA
jgi:CheY-like chemotaxis protein